MAGGIDAAASSVWTPSQVNSFRISAVADRLSHHVAGAAPNDDASEFFNLCLSLSRGIDYAVANNEVPGKAQDLPNLLKKVCQRKAFLLQAAIMVLMVSVKSACKTGWFSAEDSRELLSLADEVASSFSSIRDMNTEVSGSLQNISTIISRFFPQLKIGQILSFLDVKPGYGTYLTDFHIAKNAKPSGEEKVRLFVAQTDNMETSSCLISPPQANFLINGKGVERRTNVFLESGPLLPTIITHMLKFGTNILQVVGQFTGNYAIVVAYMSVISNLDRSTLLDYVRPEVAVQDQDSELVEGPSRISLNCPISFQRIRTPVKGHSCKHIQCFDFDNFVDINSRRPSWRCPHCNQCVSYVDIRVDQYMAKVLIEVGKDVSEVIISADGSWKPVTEGHESSDPPCDVTPSSQQDIPDLQESSNISNAPLDLMDLTAGDDIMDELSLVDTPDVKPILPDISNHLEVRNATLSPGMNNPNVVSQNDDGPEPDFWSQMYLSTYSPEGTAAISQPQMFGSISGSASSNLQLQLSQFGSSLVSNEYGSNPQVTRPRLPVAVQALPVQSPTSVPQHSLLSQNSPNATPSMGDSLNTNYITFGRQIQNSRSHLNSLQSPQMNLSHFNPVHMSPMNSSSLPQFQTQTPQSNSSISSPPTQQIMSPPGLLANTSSRLSSHPLPPPHLRIPHVMGQSPNLNRSSTQSPRNHTPFTQQQTLSAQRPPHLAVGRHHTTSSVLNQPNRASPSVQLAGDGIRVLMGGEQRANAVNISSSSAGPANVSPAEDSWKPTGRMRGALQGQAYSAALQQFIFQPAQPVQATRPPTLPVPLPLNMINVLAANSRTALAASPGVPSPSTVATAASDTSATVPEPTSAHSVTENEK